MWSGLWLSLNFPLKHVPPSLLGAMLGDVLAGPKSPRWTCSCGMDGNWASRTTCRNCWEPAPQRIVDAARAAAKRCGKGRGGTKLKGYDLAGFKREVLAEVRNTIRDACATSSEPASGRGSTVESDGGDGNGSEKQGTVARRGALGHGDPGASECAGARPRRGHEAAC